jgi:hypothetical protein
MMDGWVMKQARSSAQIMSVTALFSLITFPLSGDMTPSPARKLVQTSDSSARSDAALGV